MDRNTVELFFAVLRCAICGNQLKESEKECLSEDILQKLFSLSKHHNIAHLYATGLDKNGLLKSTDDKIGKEIIVALYRYTQLNYEYLKLCDTLEAACIPFIPLKGSVLRQWYPEPWMRNSCDIDILVHKEDIKQAINILTENLGYTESTRSTHDITLVTQKGISVELHFDLIEEGRANNAIDILSSVWDNVSPKSGCQYHCEMTDEFFYFYHIAHMAKHFEVGGCGIRPFIDLVVLDGVEYSQEARNELLKRGELLKFAESARELSRAWFNDEKLTETAFKMQDYILRGGVYGTSENRVAVNQAEKGGKKGYIFSRVFIPFEKLKRYYPILERHRWLALFMQVRRWFMLLKPNVRQMAKQELSANKNTDQNKAEEMSKLLKEIGL